MNKSSQIIELLMEGHNTRYIAAQIKCSLGLVSTVRKKCARRLGIKEAQCQRIQMQIGPWVREPSGILSREIRGT